VNLVPAVLVLALQLTLPALAANQPAEQTVTPIPADTEQRIEALTPPAEQRVEALDPDTMQRVGAEGTTGPVGRGFKAAAKVAVGVLAAGVSLGVMLASLLLI
jgi:hypothetical protein